jgi:HEAT repeat protein
MKTAAVFAAALLALLSLSVGGLSFPAAFHNSASLRDSKSAKEILDNFRRDWQAQPGYMRAADDRGWKGRMVALCELIKLGKDAVPALAEALDDKDAEVRAFAAQALGFLADASVSGRMDRLLSHDADPITRLYAADALGMGGGMKPKELYAKAEKEDANKDVRAHVRFALERNGDRLPPSVQKLFTEFDQSKIDTARLGEPAPDFELTDALDKTYRLSDFRGKKAVVLVFIYGDT